MSEILICGVNWIGDSIMTMPALQTFKKQHVAARVTLLIKSPLIPLWEMQHCVDEIMCLEQGLAGTWHTVKRVSERHFDAAYVLPHSFRSALIPFLAHVPDRIGMPGHSRDWMLSKLIRVERLMRRTHQAYEYMTMLVPGLRDVDLPAPLLAVPSRAMEQANELLPEKRPLIGLIPGAARGPSKRWPIDHFIAAGRQLCDQLQAGVAVFGSPAERSLCEGICAGIGSDCVNLAGRTDLQVWAACLKTCDAVISNDSGGMHLAAAVGTYVVALYGMTDPSKTGPLGTCHTILQESDECDRDIRRSSKEAQDKLALILPETVFNTVRDHLELSAEGISDA